MKGVLTSTQMLHHGQWWVRGGWWKQHLGHHCRRKALWFTHTTGAIMGPSSLEPCMGRELGSNSSPPITVLLVGVGVPPPHHRAPGRVGRRWAWESPVPTRLADRTGRRWQPKGR